MFGAGVLGDWRLWRVGGFFLETGKAAPGTEIMTLFTMWMDGGRFSTYLD